MTATPERAILPSRNPDEFCPTLELQIMRRSSLFPRRKSKTELLPLNVPRHTIKSRNFEIIIAIPPPFQPLLIWCIKVFAMSEDPDWVALYRAALQESDRDRLLTRIEEAERAMKQALRLRLSLATPPSGTESRKLCTSLQ
jgi:hypothetical protein